MFCCCFVVVAVVVGSGSGSGSGVGSGGVGACAVTHQHLSTQFAFCNVYAGARLLRHPLVAATSSGLILPNELLETRTRLPSPDPPSSYP